MIIRNKNELEAQIKNNKLTKSDADFLRKVYAEHERSNVEQFDNGYAKFKEECIANGICDEDIKTAWSAIQNAKNRKSKKSENTVSLEDLINHVNNKNQ